MLQRCRRFSARLPKDLSGHADLLAALADPHRLRIVATLARADDDICVCDLNDDIDVSQPTVSHHLRLLKEAGVVASERRGTWVYYHLEKGVRARVMSVLDAILPERIFA